MVEIPRSGVAVEEPERSVISEPDDIDLAFFCDRCLLSVGRWMLSVSERMLGGADDADGWLSTGASLNVSVLAIFIRLLYVPLECGITEGLGPSP